MGGIEVDGKVGVINLPLKKVLHNKSSNDALNSDSSSFIMRIFFFI